MSRAEWGRKREGQEEYEGPRVAEPWEIGFFGFSVQEKIDIIFDALERGNLIYLRYDGFDRVVAPFVVGVSSEGNPLLRGYQLEGNSRSGKGEGWRVYQIEKMEGVESFQDFFFPEDFDFDRFYPWTYKVFKMI